MKVSISHIALYVRKLEKSTQFYAEVMQLQGIPEPFGLGKHSWFQIGERCQLHLIVGAKDQVKHDINNHISFSTHSIDEFVKRLDQAGIDYYDPFKKKGQVYTRPDGIKQIFFQDPDGYWLEMNDELRSQT